VRVSPVISSSDHIALRTGHGRVLVVAVTARRRGRRRAAVVATGSCLTSRLRGLLDERVRPGELLGVKVARLGALHALCDLVGREARVRRSERDRLVEELARRVGRVLNLVRRAPTHRRALLECAERVLITAAEQNRHA
jgi:hypothetical protein